MVFGITAKSGSRLFTVSFCRPINFIYFVFFSQRYDLTNSVMNKDRLSFSAAVFMSLIGLGVSVFSTNKLLLASSSTRSILSKSK